MNPTIVFGNGELIATPALAPKSKALGINTSYGRPSFDPFFSPYGFCYPLTGDTGPIDVILDGKLPFLGDRVDPFHRPRRWLRVDHNGDVWRILIQATEEGDLVSSAGMVMRNCGWWMTSDVEEGELDELTPLMLGFLYSDPPVKKINTQWRKLFGEELVWFNLIGIAAKLRTEFPPPKPNPQVRGLRKNIHSLVNVIFDQKMAELESRGK